MFARNFFAAEAVLQALCIGNDEIAGGIVFVVLPFDGDVLVGYYGNRAVMVDHKKPALSVGQIEKIKVWLSVEAIVYFVRNGRTFPLIGIGVGRFLSVPIQKSGFVGLSIYESRNTADTRQFPVEPHPGRVGVCFDT